MTTIKNVAVAGATGSLGEPLVKELLKAGFSVTALTRPDSKQTLPDSVKVVKVDYNDIENLTAALKGQDAVVSTIASAGIGQQEHLMDAAIAAGVKRLIPSEFGCDLSIQKNRKLPVYGQKVKIQEKLESACKGTHASYTFVYNNAFLDWGVEKKFIINLKDKQIELADGGNTNFTVTPLALVAKGVVGVLQHPEETANKEVRLHGARLNQKQFLEIGQRIVGKDGWQITEASTDDIEQRSWEAFKKTPENYYSWMVGFLKRALYAEGWGQDFSEKNDNELLGIKELSEQEVEDVIRSAA